MKAVSRHTGWATGYDLIPVRVYMCPEHGEVASHQLIGPTLVNGVVQTDESGRIQWRHKGCGLKVERREGTIGDRP